MTSNTTNLGATTPLPKVGSPFVFIERTSSSRLRLLAVAAHVELQGLPFEVKR
jgi:hypothetical protein